LVKRLRLRLRLRKEAEKRELESEQRSTKPNHPIYHYGIKNISLDFGFMIWNFRFGIFLI
jgi:hypothetical protein